MRTFGITPLIEMLPAARVRLASVAVVLACGGARLCQAQDVITLGAAPSATISTAVAGLPPTAATASSTWTTTGVDHGTNRLIYVRLASTPPAGVTITALLAAPATDIQGATTTLTTSYQALETNIHPSLTPYAITYTVSATSAVAPQTQGITVYYCLVRQGSSTSSVPCP